MAIFYLPPLLDPGKKVQGQQGSRDQPQTKILCSPFFWWNFLVQTFQDLHDFLHDFFKTPVGWSFLTTTYRPQGDQGDQGTHLACSTVSPWYSSRHSLHLNGCQGPFPVFMDHSEDSNLKILHSTAFFNHTFVKEYEIIWNPLQQLWSSSPTTLMLCKCLRTICMEYLESHRPPTKISLTFNLYIIW